MPLSDPAPSARYFVRRLIEDEQGRGWLDYRVAPGGTAEIVNIEVANEHRRQGVGRTLLARMIAELPPDCRTVYAFTTSTNRSAHEWYRRVGFEMHAIPRFYASMNEDAFCCVKQI